MTYYIQAMCQREDLPLLFGYIAGQTENPVTAKQMAYALNYCADIIKGNREEPGVTVDVAHEALSDLDPLYNRDNRVFYQVVDIHDYESSTARVGIKRVMTQIPAAFGLRPE